jgi:hypothetical protein
MLTRHTRFIAQAASGMPASPAKLARLQATEARQQKRQKRKADEGVLHVRRQEMDKAKVLQFLPRKLCILTILQGARRRQEIFVPPWSDRSLQAFRRHKGFYLFSLSRIVH